MTLMSALGLRTLFVGVLSALHGCVFTGVPRSKAVETAEAFLRAIEATSKRESKS